MNPGLDIVYEDERLLVLNKSSGIAVQTKSVTEQDLTSLVKNYLSEKGEKAYEAEAVNRLDQPVGGLVLFGKNKDTVRKLNISFAERSCEKRYYAVVCGALGRTDEVCLSNYIKKDPKAGKAVICGKDEAGAKEAVLKYRVLEENLDLGRSLLDIQLMTGRFHQIRAQLSNEGSPVAGDVKYGALREPEKKGRIALYAYKLVIKTQGRDGTLSFELEPDSPAIVDFRGEWFYTNERT